MGSRMIDKKLALKGGMPLYKFVGNIILTKIQNFLLGTSFAEFHTGYRIYSINSLKKNLDTFPLPHSVVERALPFSSLPKYLAHRKVRLPNKKKKHPRHRSTMLLSHYRISVPTTKQVFPLPRRSSHYQKSVSTTKKCSHYKKSVPTTKKCSHYKQKCSHYKKQCSHTI